MTSTLATTTNPTPTPDDKPSRAVLYCRISDDPHDKQVGVKDQEKQLRELARRLGWGVGSVVVENDTSAFKRKKVTLPDGRRAMRVFRPAWRRMLDDLSSGRADGLMAVDLDRACRDPRDLEDLIDVIEELHPRDALGMLRRIPVESASGSLRLATDADITMARVSVAFANKSSRDTSRRVKRAYFRQVMNGELTGGRRRYGHEGNGKVRADEAAVLRAAAEGVLSGVSLAAMVRDLNDRGVPSATGGRWTTQVMSRMLQQPRVAGLVRFEGRIIEDVASPFEPIIERSQWEGVVGRLKRNESAGPGPTPRHLLSGVAICGHPSHAFDNEPFMMSNLTVQRDKDGQQKRLARYACSAARHLSVARSALDLFVVEAVIGLLPDVVLNAQDDNRVKLLQTERASLQARIDTLGDLLESGDMSAGEYRLRKGRLTEELTRVQDEIDAATGTSPLAGLAGRSDDKVWEDWEKLDLARKKAAISELMLVRVLPAQNAHTPIEDRVQLVDPRTQQVIDLKEK